MTKHAPMVNTLVNRKSNNCIATIQETTIDIDEAKLLTIVSAYLITIPTSNPPNESMIVEIQINRE